MSAVEPLVLARVIRDVLDSFTPLVSLRITYNNRLLVAGAELRPSAIVNKPRVDVGGTDLRVFYTLVSKDVILLCVMTM
jgi:protein FLOWERING LOCUS T